MLKETKDYIPVITFLLVAGNAVQLSTYYSFFSIDIFNYLDFTEIALGFLDEIFSYSFIFIFLLFSQLIEDFFGEKRDITNDNNYKRNIVVGFFGLIIIHFVVYFISSNYFLNEATSAFAILLLILIYLFFSIKSNKVNRQWKYYGLIPVYLLLCFYYAHFKYHSIEERESSSKNEIVMNNGEVIKTNKSLIFIGQTKSHVFLYNKKEKFTSIIKWDNINKIDVTKKKKK